MEMRDITPKSNKTDLPLFVASRNRILRYQLPRVNSIFKKYNFTLKRYMKREFGKWKRAWFAICYQTGLLRDKSFIFEIENNPFICIGNNLEKYETNSRRLNKFLDSQVKNVSLECSHSLSADRKYNEDPPWIIPPNIYHTEREPFESKKGLYGAFWSKSPRFPPKPRKPKIHMCLKARRLLYLSKKKRLIDKTCKKYKNICFGSAKRHQTPDIRHQSGSYRVTIHAPRLKTYKKYQERIKTRKGPTPYEVYKSLLVSVKYDALCRSYTGFEAGPGRYETRYRHLCPCPKNLIYHSNINDLILNQLHAKWLGLKPIKIDLSKYCCPEWNHVVGHGHCRLFKLQKSNVKTVHSIKSATVRSLRRVTPDGGLKYILALRSVQAKVDSNLMGNIPSLPFRIKYNVFIKPPMKRTILLKKIAFGSSLSRFPASGRTKPTFSTSMQHFRHLLQRRSSLSAHSDMKKKFSHVKSNLFKIPSHLQTPELKTKRKTFLRFRDLPRPTRLLLDDDTHTQTSKTVGLYSKPLDIKDFVKSGVPIPSAKIFKS